MIFRKTVNGCSIFGDRFVDWTMRDLRVFLGDFARDDAHNSYVYHISLVLNEKKILRNVMKKEKKVDRATEQRHLRINKVYCEAFVYFMESNIWGVAMPKKVPAKPWMERNAMDEEWENNEGTTPAGGAILNPELCFAYSEGYKRWERVLSQVPC